MSTTTKPPTVPAYVNWIVQRMLHSPLHPIFSKTLMEMTLTGRKSGKQYTVVVRYLREFDDIVCFTDSKWWLNLRGGAPVEMLIAGRAVPGTAVAVTDRTTVTAALAEFLDSTPGDAKYYGVRRTPDGRPIADDIRAAAEYTTMVRITPN
ncbi:hypothetical protein [Nocardia sp. NPDC020380]|uniref:hypothetical protein n=1 Tax=Nocardia sp. NPDC020380 TaxID=3364309 RepID=UPI0037B84D78